MKRIGLIDNLHRADAQYLDMCTKHPFAQFPRSRGLLISKDGFLVEAVENIGEIIYGLDEECN